MKDLLTTLENRRTIREFTDERIDEKTIQTILDALMHSPTSNGLQQASIIRITDEEKKKQIAEVGNQEYIARVPELFIFIADHYRNFRLIRDFGRNYDTTSNVDIFVQGLNDAVILATNMVSIVESMDLGAFFIGSIMNDTEKMIEILDLPKLTFPVVGVGFGHPNQSPQMKPKMPKELRVFENTYTHFEDYKETFHDYDEEMTTYYDLRDANRRVDSFSDQVYKKTLNSLEKRNKFLEVARKNSYKL
ncbi:nitroreductase family protein [Peptoniphilus sp.]|jgi:nitroreductase|uniref:nitroreductase family protein n=1 Tax=Peptoniphilus sp. TaxID=1971214 RepID=UPI003D89E015